MKTLIGCAVLILASPLGVVAQNNKAEQEVRGFLADYDKAVSSRDIAFLERVLPEDYVITGASGRASNRAQTLRYFARERDKPSYRMNSLRHENVKVRVAGSMAVVTNDYTARTTPIESPDADPDVTTGRHTGVFEKRNGRWMVIAEHDTELPHDDKVMEQQVLKAGRGYHDLMKRLKSGRNYAELEKGGDLAALKRLLADEYIYTSRDGKTFNKAEALDGLKTNQTIIESAEVSEQRVLAIDNNAAVETGSIRYVGTDAGKPFDMIGRYTTTWVSWSAGWQIVAEHTSVVKPKE